MTNIHTGRHDEQRLDARALSVARAEYGEADLIRGTVYGVALNHADDAAQATLAAGKGKPAPQAPVMFIKPRNTFVKHGDTVHLPHDLQAVEACAALGVVFARDAHQVPVERALDYIAGYTLAIDLAEPGAGYFRPPIREKCRDGFLPVGPTVIPADRITDPDNLEVHLEIDGKRVASVRGEQLIRPLAQLIADVSGYMTFAAGDVLLGIITSPGPQVPRGGRVDAAADGLGRLSCLVAEQDEVLA